MIIRKEHLIVRQWCATLHGYFRVTSKLLMNINSFNFYIIPRNQRFLLFGNARESQRKNTCANVRVLTKRCELD